jgi:hypothetical protein
VGKREAGRCWKELADIRLPGLALYILETLNFYQVSAFFICYDLFIWETTDALRPSSEVRHNHKLLSGMNF